MSATKSIPARTCATAPASRCSSTEWTSTRAPTCSTTRATSCCSSSTTEYIDLYHSRIKAFHVKDAEFRPTGRQGVYGGFQSWKDRAGRFRSLGDGQVDFRAIFSKLTQYGYRGWAVLEWECCIKHPEQGAAEGAPFISDHLIRVAERAFDDFAASGTDSAANRRMLGLG